MSWTLKEGCIISESASPEACAGALAAAGSVPGPHGACLGCAGRWEGEHILSWVLLLPGCDPVGVVGPGWLGQSVGWDLILHSLLLSHPGVMAGAALAEGWGGGTEDHHWDTQRRGARRDTPIPFAGVFANGDVFLQMVMCFFSLVMC